MHRPSASRPSGSRRPLVCSLVSVGRRRAPGDSRSLWIARGPRRLASQAPTDGLRSSFNEAATSAKPALRASATLAFRAAVNAVGNNPRPIVALSRSMGTFCPESSRPALWSHLLLSLRRLPESQTGRLPTGPGDDRSVEMGAQHRAVVRCVAVVGDGAVSTRNTEPLNDVTVRSLPDCRREQLPVISLSCVYLPTGILRVTGRWPIVIGPNVT